MSATQHTVLVVEDEEDIQELLRYNLEEAGYQVLVATTGEEGLKLAQTQRPQLVLLDLMLPGMNGLDVCRYLKNNAQTQSIPVIMVTAKGEEDDVVLGLETGAEDYLVKPFSNKVLLARVQVALRREVPAEPSTEGVLQIYNLSIHPGRRQVKVSGNEAELTYGEFEILFFLARRPGWVFTRRQIVSAVHGEDHPVTERSVDVLMVSLRKKLGAAGDYIETVRGVGYRFSDGAHG